MDDAIFTCCYNDQLTDTPAVDLFRDKRILVCTVNTPHHRITQVYCKYLEKLKKKISKYNIENIYTINFNDPWCFAVINDFFPTLTPLLNRDLKFLYQLKNIYNSDSKWSIEFLSEVWEFQVLVNNGKIEFFNQSDTKDIAYKIVRACKNTRDQGRNRDSQYKKDLPYYFSNVLSMSKKNPSLILRQPGFYDDVVFSRSIRYQNLWPAQNLLDYLERQPTSIK